MARVERVILKMASVAALAQIVLGAQAFCQSVQPAAPIKAEESQEVNNRNTKTNKCCRCFYNGNPDCEKDVVFNTAFNRWEYKGSPTIHRDCYYDEKRKQFVNRWKSNCEQFVFPQDCDRTSIEDLNEGADLADYMKNNRCKSNSEWIYQHGRADHCVGYFDRLICMATHGVNGNISLLSCNVFASSSQVKKEIERVRKELESICFTGNLTITAYPQIVMIDTSNKIKLCPDQPTAVDGIYNVPYTLNFDGSTCRGQYVSCREVIRKKRCPFPDQQALAYCVEETQGDGDSRKKVIQLMCEQVRDANGKVTHAVWVPNPS